MEDKLLQSIKEYLVRKHNCHSIILYGSFASGDYTEESDIDLLCFCEDPIEENDTSILDNRSLDAWIYKTEKMKDYDQFLQVAGGKVLIDKRNKCIEFLENVEKRFKNGPVKMTSNEKEFYKRWLQKMLHRSRKGDVEGNYRYHWMLNDSLEIYFNIKDRWYLGPKKSLNWLMANDCEAFELFHNALKTDANIGEVEKLIEFIIES